MLRHFEPIIPSQKFWSISLFICSTSALQKWWCGPRENDQEEEVSWEEQCGRYDRTSGRGTWHGSRIWQFGQWEQRKGMNFIYYKVYPFLCSLNSWIWGLFVHCTLYRVPKKEASLTNIFSGYVLWNNKLGLQEDHAEECCCKKVEWRSGKHISTHFEAVLSRGVYFSWSVEFCL